MKYSRVIGQNIQLALKNSGITFSQLREKLGYSEKDLCRILEGVLYVSSKDKILDYIDLYIELAEAVG